MVVFLANRSNLQTKRLHGHIKNRLATEFTAVTVRKAERREPGPYRVVGSTNPRQYFGNVSYPVSDGRIEVGFKLATEEEDEWYWVNWIEPARNLLIGWHRDGTHADLGPVHLQLTWDGSVIEHRSATYIDAHPLDVLEQRLEELESTIASVTWEEDQPTGFRTDET